MTIQRKATVVLFMLCKAGSNVLSLWMKSKSVTIQRKDTVVLLLSCTRAVLTFEPVDGILNIVTIQMKATLLSSTFKWLLFSLLNSSSLGVKGFS